jgi:uncharacterized protein (DUF433 family)
MGMSERITVMPDICNGKLLGAGDSVDDVLAEYPSLSREDVQACIDYAARVMGNHYSVASVK